MSLTLIVVAFGMIIISLFLYSRESEGIAAIGAGMAVLGTFAMLIGGINMMMGM